MEIRESCRPNKICTFIKASQNFAFSINLNWDFFSCVLYTVLDWCRGDVVDVTIRHWFVFLVGCFMKQKFIYFYKGKLKLDFSINQDFDFFNCFLRTLFLFILLASEIFFSFESYNTFLDPYLAHKNNMDQLIADLLREIWNKISWCSRRRGRLPLELCKLSYFSLVLAILLIVHCLFNCPCLHSHCWKLNFTERNFMENQKYNNDI
jgi:hypothetical protein